MSINDYCACLRAFKFTDLWSCDLNFRELKWRGGVIFVRETSLIEMRLRLHVRGALSSMSEKQVIQVKSKGLNDRFSVS